MMRFAAVIAFVLAGSLFAQEPAADLAGIEVHVLDRDGRPIAGLTHADFEVSIGGRSRPVVSARFVGADVPAAADGSTGASALIAPVEGRLFVMVVDAASFNAAESAGIGSTAQGFVDQLSKHDRVAVFTFPAGPRVEATTDRAPVREALEAIVPQQASSGMTTFRRTIDGLGEVLRGAGSSSQRKFVVLVTAGTKPEGSPGTQPDPANTSTGLAQQAAASNAAIYSLFVGHSFLELTIPRKPSTLGASVPRTLDDDGLENWLAQLSGRTGGALIKVGGASSDAAVSRLLLETSGYYRIALALSDAERIGPAQPFAVKVKHETAIVRARSWLGTPGRVATASASVAPPAVAALPTRPAPRRAVPADSIAGAYERGEFASVRDRLVHLPDLTAWIRELRDEGKPWPDAPRRTSMFALEVAAAALATDNQAAVAEAVALLAQQGSDAAAPVPDAFECAWYWAGLMLFQTGGYADTAKPFIGKAATRCANEPRVILAEAVIADQASPVLGPAVRGPADAAAEAALHESVIARYKKAEAFPETAAEAQVREAWLQFRMKRFDEALALTNTLPPPVAPAEASGLERDLNRQVAYIGHFVRGQVLREQKDLDGAADAFRQALTVWPGAQSASVSLMTLLAARGQRSEAERIAVAVESARESDVDPWWWFWYGDRQLYTLLLDRLREHSR